MADMTGNLGKELEAFRERIKRDKSVTVTQAPGASRGGGGAAGPAGLVLLLSACALAARGARAR